MFTLALELFRKSGGAEASFDSKDERPDFEASRAFPAAVCLLLMARWLIVFAQESYTYPIKKAKLDGATRKSQLDDSKAFMDEKLDAYMGALEGLQKATEAFTEATVEMHTEREDIVVSHFRERTQGDAEAPRQGQDADQAPLRNEATIGQAGRADRRPRQQAQAAPRLPSAEPAGEALPIRRARREGEEVVASSARQDR
jgi:hypothetical protein